MRDAYRRLVAQGWTDAVRHLHPGERIYTFWKYFRNAFARDAGLRIDHLLLSPPLAKRSPRPAWTARCAAANTRATMLPPGSSLPSQRRHQWAGVDVYEGRA